MEVSASTQGKIPLSSFRLFKKEMQRPGTKCKVIILEVKPRSTRREVRKKAERKTTKEADH